MTCSIEEQVWPVAVYWFYFLYWLSGREDEISKQINNLFLFVHWCKPYRLFIVTNRYMTLMNGVSEPLLNLWQMGRFKKRSVIMASFRQFQIQFIKALIRLQKFMRFFESILSVFCRSKRSRCLEYSVAGVQVVLWRREGTATAVFCSIIIQVHAAATV